MKKVISISIMLMTILMFCAGASAKTFNLKLATIVSDKDPWGQFVRRMTVNIKKNTNGTVNITPYMSGKLGTGNDTIKQIARGRIDMGGLQLPDVESLIKELGVMGTPFFFTSAEQRDCAMDTYLAPPLDKMLQKKGLKLIQYLYGGAIGVSSTFPIVVPEDVKGVKMRSALATNSILMWKSVGANVVPLDLIDYPSAVQTGLVKGGPVSPVFYVLAGFNKLAPHYTFLEQFYNPGFILMNLKVWNSMSKTQQQQIMGSLEDTGAFRKQIRGFESSLLDKYEKAGGAVHRLTPEQKQKWVDAVTPHQKEMITMIGGNSQAMWDLLSDARAACSK